jgi:hypothetical protein
VTELNDGGDRRSGDDQERAKRGKSVDKFQRH